MSDTNHNTKKPMKSVSKWFWGTFFLLIVLSAFLEYRMGILLNQNTDGSIIREEGTTSSSNRKNIPKINIDEAARAFQNSILILLDDGKKRYVPKKDFIELTDKIHQSIGAFEENASLALEQKINELVDENFNECKNNIDAYADWYFGIAGGYQQLGSAITGNIKELMSEKLEELVIKPCNLANKLEENSNKIDVWQTNFFRETTENTKQLIETWAHENDLKNKHFKVLSDNKIDSITPAAVLDLNKISEKAFFSYIESAIPSAVGSAAGGIASVVIMKAVAKKLGPKLIATITGTVAFKSMAKVLTKVIASLMVKSAGKGAAAASGAGTGALACAWAGPFAAACAAAGGLVAWVAADAAISKIDDLVNRDDFKNQIESAFDQAALQVKQEFTEPGKDMVNKYFTYLQIKIKLAENSIK